MGSKFRAYFWGENEIPSLFLRPPYLHLLFSALSLAGLLRKPMSNHERLETCRGEAHDRPTCGRLRQLLLDRPHGPAPSERWISDLRAT